MVVLETLVLITNKAPLMKSSQTFSFSSLTFLRMLNERKDITVIEPACIKRIVKSRPKDNTKRSGSHLK